MDRIDIHVEVPRVDYDKLSSDRLGEPSARIRKRVEAARDIQRQRFKGKAGCNADLGPAEVRQYCEIDQAGKSLLRAAMQQLAMSGHQREAGGGKEEVRTDFISDRVWSCL